MLRLQSLSCGIVFALLLASAACTREAPGPNAMLGACYLYRDSVQFAGRIVRETHPGRPNYESIADGDEAESGFYLHLASPVCMRPDAADSAEFFRTSIDSVTRIQLVLDSAEYVELRSLLDTVDVVLRGEPFGPHTGHHHAPLLVLYHRGSATAASVATR